MTFPELLAAIRTSTMVQIVNSSDEGMAELLSAACPLFDHYSLTVQTTTMACMLAMILATIEGETSLGERELGLIITHKERIDIFLAQFHAVFTEAMAARATDPSLLKSKAVVN